LYAIAFLPGTALSRRARGGAWVGLGVGGGFEGGLACDVDVKRPPGLRVMEC